MQNINPISKAINNGKMRSIEGARGIAALMVLMMHSANLMSVEHFSGHIGLDGIFNFGYVGVDFFFVLSGFIITYVHFFDIGIPSRLPAYLWRRLTRIYPIFWFCLLMQVLVILLGRLILNHDAPIQFTSIDVLATIFLVKVADPQFIGVAWSLQYEVMFYLIFCILFLNRRIGSIVFTLWAAAIAWRTFVEPTLPTFAGLLSAHCLQFITGICVGIMVRRTHSNWVGLTTLAVSMLCFAATVYYEMSIAVSRHGDIGRVLIGLSSALILFTLVELEKRNLISTPRILYRLGSVSYSVYLAHIMFVNVIYSILLKLGVYHNIPESAVFSLAVCGALTGSLTIGFLIELPLVNKLKNMVPSRSSPPR